MCLPAALVCDGRRSCLHGEDEQSCGPRTCDAGLFVCQNGVCIPQRWVCDRDNDCGDMSDEPANCSMAACRFLYLFRSSVFFLKRSRGSVVKAPNMHPANHWRPRESLVVAGRASGRNCSRAPVKSYLSRHV